MSSSEQLKIVIVGHVDHGKSTLVGRLFADTDSLPEGRLEQLQASARRRGMPFEWASLTDALQAERDQNVTIDTTQIWFSTEKRRYVIIDAPGHEASVDVTLEYVEPPKPKPKEKKPPHKKPPQKKPEDWHICEMMMEPMDDLER